MIRPTYRSGTLILVEQPSVPEKYVVSNIDSDIQHQLDSITQQILSRTRLLRIIDTLGLYARERKHMSEDDLVERMRKDTEIELSHGDDRKLSAFNIYYSSHDPKTHSGRRTNWQICSSPRIWRSGKSVPRTQPTSLGPVASGTRQTGGPGSEDASVQGSASGRVAHPDAEQSADPGRSPDAGGANEDALNRAKQQNTYLESLVNQYRAMGGSPKASESGQQTGLGDIDKQLDQLKAQLADLTRTTPINIPMCARPESRLRCSKPRASGGCGHEQWS